MRRTRPMAAITQRVDVHPDRDERRDALDQRLGRFLLDLGVVPVPVPNLGSDVVAWFDDLRPDVVVLSGGNDPLAVGGSTPERDLTDATAIEHARRHDLPLVAICRGLQSLVLHDGGRLEPGDGHAGTRHHLSGELGGEVLSHHDWVVPAPPEGHQVVALAPDRTVEAVRVGTRTLGVMWHPERMGPPWSNRDVGLVREVLVS
ncbi:MAG: gamma-glutamyl-gamma-aminobutyrate hydrolase family protein [Actinomycetota bacterium]